MEADGTRVGQANIYTVYICIYKQVTVKLNAKELLENFLRYRRINCERIFSKRIS